MTVPSHFYQQFKRVLVVLHTLKHSVLSIFDYLFDFSYPGSQVVVFCGDFNMDFPIEYGWKAFFYVLVGHLDNFFYNATAQIF